MSGSAGLQFGTSLASSATKSKAREDGYGHRRCKQRPGGETSEAGATTPFDKVHAALRGMGFRDVEARNAISVVRGMHDANEPPETSQLLREAVLVATAA